MPQASNPETYGVAEALLKQLGYSKDETEKRCVPGLHKKSSDYKKLAEELGTGELTLRDIVGELEKPGRDPREDMPKPILLHGCP